MHEHGHIHNCVRCMALAQRGSGRDFDDCFLFNLQGESLALSFMVFAFALWKVGAAKIISTYYCRRYSKSIYRLRDLLEAHALHT